MKIKGITDECFGDYSKAAMYIAMPTCSFKCDKENKTQLCQNWELASAPTIEIDINTLINRYLNNPITEAIIFSGLEPLDSFIEVYCFVKKLRQRGCTDDIVIYTGYNKDEVFNDAYKPLFYLGNIYVKFGRFRPNEEAHYDEVLGVKLASSNQYAEKLS